MFWKDKQLHLFENPSFSIFYDPYCCYSFECGLWWSGTLSPKYIYVSPKLKIGGRKSVFSIGVDFLPLISFLYPISGFGEICIPVHFINLFFQFKTTPFGPTCFGGMFYFLQIGASYNFSLKQEEK